ncbi:MAG: helix-hairpin-helix domain-containing protein [Bacteroidetes bacterium]|nr:helix-hairpin-helix domain-containing protein [Bacteroidota bacterium]
MVRPLKYLMPIVLCAGGLVKLQAQVPELIRDQLEKYLEYNETQGDYTQLYDQLSGYLERPVAINQATVEELQAFPLWSPVQASNLVAHREKYGHLNHLAELQVCGFSPEQIRALAPFVTLEWSAAQNWNLLLKDLKKGRNDFALITRLAQKNQLPADITGDRWSVGLRYRYSLAQRFSVGFSAEKDPGEVWWRKGPDHRTFHLYIQQVGKLQAAVIGDYQLQMGQGLVLGSGIGMGKSAGVLMVKRAGPNLKAYRGMNEFLFLRGAAAQWKTGKWLISAAASSKRMDGRVSDSGTITSSDLDGLHRTPVEIATRWNLSRQMAGAWLQKNGKRGHAGSGITHFQYSAPLSPPDGLYYHYHPKGNVTTFIHAWQAHTFGRVHVFSEWAWLQQQNAHAAIAGMLTPLGSRIEFCLVYRDYHPAFNSPFSTAFGNSGRNEKGLYSGWVFHFNRKWQLSQYTDIWQAPWPGFRLYSSTKNSEMLWQLDFIPDKKSHMYLRFRDMNKAIPDPESMPLKGPVYQRTQNLRLHFSTQLNSVFQMDVRGEQSVAVIDHKSNISSLFYTEISARIRKLKSRMSARYTLFRATTFTNRLYAYENQLMYDYGNIQYYGSGYSVYLMLNTRIFKQQLGLRMSYSSSDKANSGIPRQSVFIQWMKQW